MLALAGWLLIGFSVLGCLWAFLGLIDPEWPLSNRSVPIWVRAVGAGLLLSGGIMIAPPNGDRGLVGWVAGAPGCEAPAVLRQLLGGSTPEYLRPRQQNLWVSFGSGRSPSA